MASESSSVSQGAVRVGDWLIEKSRLSIRTGSSTRSLEPRVMELLIYLTERPGELISSEQLLTDIWHGSFYGDGPVQRAMALLRRSLGDDAQAPRYIETIRKRGYRLIAPVVFPDDYLASTRAISAHWTEGSPFVGLRAFDSEHSSVFFGRGRSTALLLDAIRRQRNQGGRLVLVVGPSGCGKTSLLRAGALPLLTREGGFDALQVASIAWIDCAQGQKGDVLSLLAQALCQWRLGERPVFVDGEALAEQLRLAHEELLNSISSAFARWPHRGEQGQPLLFLLIDHAEAALTGTDRDAGALNEILTTLCSSEHVIVVMLCRSDFYPALLKHLPAVARLKAPEGHFDLLPPTDGELAEIIRRPAQAAGLVFERRQDSLLGLDDVLRDSAIAHPEALPMLQYTLQSLYEARGDGYMLSFDAYEQLGGLGGALASRAERVFAELPTAVQAAWVPVFERIVVSHESSQMLTARRLPWSVLRTPEEVELVQHLVAARLFTSSLEADAAYFTITHETLLRAWPRVQEWARDNQRHLQSQRRVKQATRRWLEAHRRADLLLSRGLPLAEASDLLQHAPRLLDNSDCELVRASELADRRRRRRRLLALTGALLLAAASVLFAILALRAHHDAERRRNQAESLVDYLLTDLADELRPLGRLSLMDHIAQRALEYLSSLPERDTDQNARVQRVRAIRTLGEVFVDRGNQEAAAQAFAQAQALLDDAPHGVDATSNQLFERGTLAYWQGALAFQKNALAQAGIEFERYRSFAAELSRREPDNADWQLELSYALNNLGSLAQRQQQTEKALALFQESAELKEKVLRQRPGDSALAVEQADSLSWIGSTLDRLGRPVEAATYFDRQLQLLRDVGTRQPSADGWRHRLALSELLAAGLHLACGRQDLAQTLHQQAERTLQELVDADNSNRTWQRNLSYAQTQVAYLLLLQRKPQAAYDKLLQAERRLKPLLLDAAAPDEWRRLSIQISLRMAQAKRADASLSAADTYSIQALKAARSVHLANPADLEARVLLARSLLIRGDVLNALSQTQSASALWHEARTLLIDEAMESRNRRVLQPWLAANARLELDQQTGAYRQRLSDAGYRLDDQLPP